MIKINFKKLNFWLISLGVFFLTLGVLALILLGSKSNPTTFFWTIFIEPWKNLNSFSNLLFTFSYILLISLAVGITFKYRVYNFGVPGQMMFSASITYVLAVAIADAGGQNRAIGIFLILVAVLVGLFSGFIISILKIYFHIHEIISTILLNFIAWEGYNGLISSSNYQGGTIPGFASLRFSLIAGPSSASNLFSWTIIIAIVVLIITVLLFNNRTLGFKLNAIAKNPIAAKQARMNPNKQILLIMPISAAIAGLAGYFYFLAVNSHLPQLNAMPQEGFYGIAVACLAYFEPLLIFFSSIIFSFFLRPIESNSFSYMENPALATLLLSIFIYFLALIPFIWHLWNQSPFIEKKLYQIKSKLFSVAREKKPEALVLNSKNQIQEQVKYIDINNTKKTKIKIIKLIKKPPKKRKGDKE